MTSIIAFHTKQFILSNPFHIQINHIQSSGLSDIDSVNAHESIHDGLSAVGGYGIAHAVCHHVNAHAALQADAAGDFAVFYCYSV